MSKFEFLLPLIIMATVCPARANNCKNYFSDKASDKPKTVVDLLTYSQDRQSKIMAKLSEINKQTERLLTSANSTKKSQKILESLEQLKDLTLQSLKMIEDLKYSMDTSGSFMLAQKFLYLKEEFINQVTLQEIDINLPSFMRSDIELNILLLNTYLNYITRNGISELLLSNTTSDLFRHAIELSISINNKTKAIVNISKLSGENLTTQQNKQLGDLQNHFYNYFAAEALKASNFDNKRTQIIFSSELTMHSQIFELVNNEGQNNLFVEYRVDQLFAQSMKRQRQAVNEIKLFLPTFKELFAEFNLNSTDTDYKFKDTPVGSFVIGVLKEIKIEAGRHRNKSNLQLIENSNTINELQQKSELPIFDIPLWETLGGRML